MKEAMKEGRRLCRKKGGYAGRKVAIREGRSL